MLKFAIAIVTAALIAAVLTGFPGDIVSPVAAGPSAGQMAIPAPACPERGWPYNHCGLKPAEIPSVRFVTSDHMR